MKIKFNLEGVEFNLEGVKNSPFKSEIEAEGKISASIKKLEIETEASIEEMLTEVKPQLKDAIKASIENQKK